MSSKNAHMVNIPRSVTDAFYRYKMPDLEPFVQSSGNGIKTALLNIADIAKALARPVTYPCRFMAYTLGATLEVNEKEGRFIINGNHNKEDLCKILDDFIDKYVLCSKCKNPETVMTIAKTRESIRLKCKACGAVTSVDALDKMGKFIVQNPPPVEKEVSRSEEESKQREEAEEAEAQKAREELEKVSIVEDESKVTWSLDTSDEAVKKRMMKNAGKASEGLFDLGSRTERMDAKTEKQMARSVSSDLQILLKKLKDKGITSQTEVTQKISDYFGKVEGLNAHAAVNGFFAGVILPDGENLIENSAQFAPVFAPFLTGSMEAQYTLLDTIERAVAKEFLKSKHVATAIKQYYDCDALEEDVITAWYEKHPDSPMAPGLKPFVDWLETAEVDESL